MHLGSGQDRANAADILDCVADEVNLGHSHNILAVNVGHAGRIIFISVAI